MSPTPEPSDERASLVVLYERFDAIAKGRIHGDSSAAHRAVLARLTSNQGRAEAAGWTDCALERLGGSGRVVLRGIPPGGAGRDVVPDQLSDHLEGLPAPVIEAMGVPIRDMSDPSDTPAPLATSPIARPTALPVSLPTAHTNADGPNEKRTRIRYDPLDAAIHGRLRAAWPELAKVRPEPLIPLVLPIPSPNGKGPMPTVHPDEHREAPADPAPGDN